MRKILRSIFPNNAGFLINAGSMQRQLFFTWRKNRAKHTELDWTTVDHSEFEVDVPLIDLAMGVYLRCIQEYGYTTVIEIGTRNGKRIRRLKELFPNLDCYGLDIQDNFKEEFEVGGVRFAHNNLEFFKKKRDKALVISRGCMAYYDPDILASFFSTLCEYQYDLAFMEPVCLGEKVTHPRMKADQSYYHPYTEMLSAAGFDISEGRHNTRFTYMPSQLEHWHLNLARCPASWASGLVRGNSLTCPPGSVNESRKRRE
jgi:hypothetical protein